MSNTRGKTWFRFGWHPAEEELLLFLDGEASERQADKLRGHLEGCWACRNRRDKFDRAIATFMNYCEAEATDASTLPPRASLQFAERLRVAASTQPKPSLITRWGNALRGLFAERRLAFVTTACLLLMAALTLIFLRAERPVSAQELLRRTTQAETLSLRRVGEPVVYRKLQVKRVGADEPVVWESWNDAQRQQFRQRVADKQGLRFLRANETATPAILIELEQIFRANHFDPQHPLSAAAFAEWRQAIKTKTETVAETKDGLRLTTTQQEPYPVKTITEASLIVRTSDWHAVALHLKVQGEKEIRAYELSETAYEVLPLQALNVFADLTPTSAPMTAPTALPSPSPATSATPVIAASASPAVAPSAVATTELEIETLALLSQAGADLGEQINVTRTPQNTLRIAGVVETEERKQQLRRALASVLTNPAVRLEIETVDEAVRRTQQTKRTAAPTTVIIEQPIIAASKLPVDAELRRYFSGQVAAAQLDEEIHKFARRTLNASFNLRQRAQAMKRLSERFTPAEWQTLDETSQAKLLNLLRTHASALQSQTRTLRQSLQPVFGNAEPPTTESEINNEAELLRTVTRLTELSATSDRTIQAAFTISAEAVSTSALKSAAFWRALAGVEQLAAKIQTNKLQREKR